jgi:hypothetical protein
MTLEVYAQAVTPAKRTAAGLIFRMEGEESVDAMVPWSPTRFVLAGRALELNFELDPNTHRAIAVRIQSQQDTFRSKRVP